MQQLLIKLLDQDCIDYAFVGEADRGILDFVEALKKKRT